MKTEQLKSVQCPHDWDPLGENRPVFAWRKFYVLEDDSYRWQLLYGFTSGRKTLCNQIMESCLKIERSPDRRRKVIAFDLHLARRELRREWHSRYPELTTTES